MSLSELTLNPPLWMHKGGDQCCNCYRWGATFDCLDDIDDLGNDWSFVGDWTLSPELIAADADNDPSTYQVTYEWRTNAAGRYSWVPISSDWHDQLGTSWKAAHPGWLEQGRQLCNGCMMSAPTIIGTPGQTVTYECSCRRSLATIVPEASAQLSNTILGSDSFHIFFKLDSSTINLDDRFRINVHSNYKIECLKHSESYYDLRLLDQDDEIIDAVEYSAGSWSPTWTFLGTELADLYGIVDYLNCSLTLTLE